MPPRASFDVVVVGAGPAGSMAALALARAGARVALVERARFPREKACGDLVGPRAVRTLADAGVRVDEAVVGGDMVVLGPSWRAVSLPWPAGEGYPSFAVASRRAVFDHSLRRAALDAGAEAVQASVRDLRWSGRRATGVVLSDGRWLASDVVVGADGSLSRVAAAAGLVDDRRALLGFALRGYVEGAVANPLLVYWRPPGGFRFPGYGWLFPVEGGVNVGLGVALGADRRGADEVAALLPSFLAAAAKRRLLPRGMPSRRELRGGWLRMGGAGITPARGNVLLVGDAAGLVNPLQGEGIAAALISGRLAAGALERGTADPGTRYAEEVRRLFGRFHTAGNALHLLAVRHPRALAAAADALTLPAVGRALGPGWAAYWNDLTDGSAGYAGLLARAFAGLGTVASVASGRDSRARPRVSAGRVSPPRRVRRVSPRRTPPRTPPTSGA